MTFSRRLKAIEKRLVPRRPPRGLKVEFVYGNSVEDTDAQIKQLRFDYGGGPDMARLYVAVVKTPNDVQAADKVTTDAVTPDNGKGEQTAELEREILLLKKQKAELQKRAKT